MTWNEKYYETNRRFTELGVEKNKVCKKLSTLRSISPRTAYIQELIDQFQAEYNELAEQQIWAARCLDEMEGNDYGNL